MCCTLTVSPIDPEVVDAVLRIGMFTSTHVGDYPHYERKVTEEDGFVVTVNAVIMPDSLKLSLFPTIASAEGHRRISGGVYLEIACKVAEKCNSTIVQSSNVALCIENSERQKVLAEYPDHPMDWSAVCVGFQAVIMGAAQG